MMLPEQCPECLSPWSEGVTCEDHFHQMCSWELEYLVYDVHHLMVLCYHIQHPSLYSPDGLRFAQHLLVEFVEQGVSPQQIRQRERINLDSGQRKLKINGTPAYHGTYQQPVVWSMTPAHVVAGGLDNYCNNVREWARCVLADLRASGILKRIDTI